MRALLFPLLAHTFLLAGCGELWNDPYPAQSYASDEAVGGVDGRVGI